MDFLGPAKKASELSYEDKINKGLAFIFRGARLFRHLVIGLVVFLLMVPTGSPSPAPLWTGVLRDKSGKPVANASIKLQAKLGDRSYASVTSANGEFSFQEIAAGSYELSVDLADKTYTAANPLIVEAGKALFPVLELSPQDGTVVVLTNREAPTTQASGGEHLSSGEVSSLPLNERDFSKLLLLAAGTMTDTNGAANFTQQFAVNGQRGSASVFAMDGADTTDPELGGATFSNFNVDAIQEVQSSSGVMPAEIGHGAAGFNNVITKSGTNDVHGSAFEFVRNAAFDARNFFDHATAVDPGRIPPFVRNEFGVTNGGPLVLQRFMTAAAKLFISSSIKASGKCLERRRYFPSPQRRRDKELIPPLFLAIP